MISEKRILRQAMMLAGLIRSKQANLTIAAFSSVDDDEIDPGRCRHGINQVQLNDDDIVVIGGMLNINSCSLIQESPAGKRAQRNCLVQRCVANKATIKVG